MFIDRARIQVKAGDGGDGMSSFRREKFVPKGGPSGGDGGRGGDVVFIVDNNVNTLLDFRYKRKFVAKNGDNGQTKNCYGQKAEPLYIKVPPGTIIKDEETGLVMADLKNDGDEFIAAKGGYGGKGNTHFKTSVRQAPGFAKAGKDGEEKNIILELRLIADVGLIGFPNVGKSTFLSIISKAKPKIANYHFTTLTPNLGVTKLKNGDSFVVADIPGIIEGANEGIGLGHDFLRHIERTKVLVHIVDISGIEGRDPLDDFEKINTELKKYNEKLSSRPQIVVANKMDILDDIDIYNNFKSELENRGYKVYSMSAATLSGVDEILNTISQMLKDAEEVDLFDEEDIYDETKVISQNIDEIKVYKENDIFIVEGNRLEKLLYSVDFEDMESIRYFQSIMEKTGVFDKLRSIGVQDGDTVRIYDLEFEYYE